MAHPKLIRIGLLGAGRHSTSNHGPALKKLAADPSQAIELAAVCDLDREKAERHAKLFGFHRACGSLDEMLALESLDALFLITPLDLTESMAARLLPLGIPLLIEKPPGTSSSAARRLRDIARQTGAPHMISFNRRFNPAFQKALGWMAEDPSRRRPQILVSRMLRHNRREPDFVVGTGIHAIDAVIAMMGPPVRVLSVMAPPASGQTRFFQAGAAFTNGGHADLLIAPSCGQHEETMEAHGEGFSFHVDFFRQTFRVHQEKKVAFEWSPPPEEKDALADVVAETACFLRGIREGSLHPDLDDGLIALQMAEAIQNGRVGFADFG